MSVSECECVCVCVYVCVRVRVCVVGLTLKGERRHVGLGHSTRARDSLQKRERV